MNSFLEQILNNKREELEEKKQGQSIRFLMEKIKRRKGERRDFVKALLSPRLGDIAIIAEIKLASPTAGILGDSNKIKNRALSYEKARIDAISVVTDKKFFGGELGFIKKIRMISSLPILCKDFIIDPYQIYEVGLTPSDALLLIAKILSGRALSLFVDLCFKLELEPVVEIGSERELENALKTNTKIIAVNSRNFTNFTVDIQKACKLMKLIPKNRITLGFSGIKSREEVIAYKNAEAKGVVVGTSLMKTDERGTEAVIKHLKGL